MKIIVKAINKETKEEARVTSLELDEDGTVNGFFIKKNHKKSWKPQYQTYDCNYDLKFIKIEE